MSVAPPTRSSKARAWRSRRSSRPGPTNSSKSKATPPDAGASRTNAKGRNAPLLYPRHVPGWMVEGAAGDANRAAVTQGNRTGAIHGGSYRSDGEGTARADRARHDGMQEGAG